ncbi:MAG: S41 family peptidase, partial [Gammaproteobacteria bacterium]
MKKLPVLLISLLLVTAFSAAGQAAGDPLLLLREPTMSKTQIVFEYGGELWEMPRAGGQAHVLASGMDLEAGPIFSPDGSMVAFSGTYDHNTDVYVVPATGGQPVRLTYHPGPDVAVGWTPDGKSVLFRSHRYSYSDPDQLYTVSVNGSFPAELPLAMAETGSYSPDGSHIAYVPNSQWEPFWQGYKGGQYTQIWISKLSDSSTVRIPAEGSDEDDPMWVGNTVYFLSTRDGPISLYGYNTTDRKITKLIDNRGFDITSASAGPGGIVYSQFGQLHIYDFATGKTHAVPVTLNGDLPQRRPYFQDVAKELSNPGISPHGVRAVFQAHGDILTVPAKHGSAINVTHSPGAMDRDPAWSPDGKSIAYFSDRDGEYDLYIRPQSGAAARKITLGQEDAYYYELTWSPNSKNLVFSDQKDNLWLVKLDAANPRPVKIATDGFNINFGNTGFNPSWAPDSRWLTFTESLPNYMRAIFIYSLADGQTHRTTNGMSNAGSPVFDANGKYLYFVASTDSGPSLGTDMATIGHAVTYHTYAVTLEPNTPSPLAPQTGFEAAPGAASALSSSQAGPKDKQEKSAPDVAIDFDGIDARIVTLPIAPGNYGLVAGPSGVLYLVKAPIVLLPGAFGPHGPALDIERFTLKDRKTENVLQGVSAFVLAADGRQMLYRRGDNWFISDAVPKARPSELDTKNLRVFAVPAEQWAEMYRDAWRIQRAFFYNPLYDGLD